MAGRVQGCFQMLFEGVTKPAPLCAVLFARRRDWAEGSLSMEFQDKILKCIDCGADFVFTAGEQLFFHDKAFRNEPKRCKACKAKRVAVLGAGPSGNHRGAVVHRATPAPRCAWRTEGPA